MIALRLVDPRSIPTSQSMVSTSVLRRRIPSAGFTGSLRYEQAAPLPEVVQLSISIRYLPYDPTAWYIARQFSRYTGQ